MIFQENVTYEQIFYPGNQWLNGILLNVSY